MRIKKARGIPVAALAVMLSATGAAAANPATGPSYNYAQLGYLNLDLDGGGSADGFGLGGSFAVSEQFHIFADYAEVSEESVKLDTMVFGGGFNTPLNDMTDFVARLGFVRAGAKVTGFFDESDNGWMVQAGVRSMVTPQFELNAFVTHTDVAGSDTSIGAGAVWHFTQNLGVFGGVDFSDGDSLAQAGVRISF